MEIYFHEHPGKPEDEVSAGRGFRIGGGRMHLKPVWIHYRQTISVCSAYRVDLSKTN